MKKNIILLLIIIFLFSIAYAGFPCDNPIPENEEECCIYDPDKCCLLYPDTTYASCGNAGGNQNQCPDSRQYIKNGKEECCPEGEEYNITRNRCVENCDGEFYGRGGLLAGNNKCCPSPGIVYDKDSVTDNYALCCEGKVYSDTEIYSSTPPLDPTQDDNLKCCTKGSAIILGTNGKNSCISCSSLKQEVLGFGITGPYTIEQEDKIAKYDTDCGNTTNCAANRKYTSNGVELCCDTDLMAGVCPINNEGNMGIDINSDCLINGQCKFNIYETLGIRQSLPAETRSSPGIFIQDIILSATFFVGTLITGVLIVSGLLYVFSGAKPELASKAKKGIMGSLIGLVFITCSYAFVRLIQFLITGGGG